MFENSIVQAIATSEAKLISKNSHRDEAPVEIWGMVFAVCLLTAVAAMFLFLTAPVWKQKKKPSVLSQATDIPCRNCRFFKDSRYLKCAVHPAIVLTQLAIDCQDYQPSK